MSFQGGGLKGKEKKKKKDKAKGGKQDFPKFSVLWGNYPHDINGEHQAPSSDSYAINQCAIRVGFCFKNSGIDLSSYPEANKTSEGYPRSSYGLANWTWKQFGAPFIMDQSSFEKNYGNRTGLIYLMPPEGGIGHIDLYNKGNTGSGYYYATEVWFWPIK